MNEQSMMDLITKFGDAGVFIAMFLESSIVPIPSEVIVAGAAAIGIPLFSILVFGSLGSTLGGVVGYLIGRHAAMPVILKFGRYIMIKPHHLQKAEAFAKKYGVWSVLIGRILPVVPFKVFSIAAGITNLPLVPFIVSTMVGVIPRMYILALFGYTIIKYKMPALIILVAVVLAFIALKVNDMVYNGKKGEKEETK
ncbi:MAG: DedA family protein [bacterium]